MQPAPVLISGQWRAATAVETFLAQSPALVAPIAGEPFPVSGWSDIDAALAAAAQAAPAMRALPGARLASFLDHYAGLVEAAASELVAAAHAETALAIRPRLAEVELPRTVNQLRMAADAARRATWQAPTIDTKLNIRSCLAPLGPVWVFGPNNFPFAFNSVAGGDFAAAIAAGNPVIAKAHPSHPGTTRLLAALALAAVEETDLPPGAVQMLYAMRFADGERAIADPRTAAVAFTGSRSAGLKLKAVADAAGKPIYLEMSSVNPVVILPGALDERPEAVAQDYVTSALVGCGQFCTNPGLVLLLAGAATETFVDTVAARFRAAPVGTLLSVAVADHLAAGVARLREAGAEALAGGTPGGGSGHSYANTLLRVSGARFLEKSTALQTEVFGPASLMVVAANEQELCQAIERLEGNLTGTIYSATGGADDALYDLVAPLVRRRVGRLLNDKMPTGVAVSPAMQHGGPYPATGHPGFTAVGIPASLRRFAGLECYDAVRPERLPPLLANHNPLAAWRFVDGQWTLAEII